MAMRKGSIVISERSDGEGWGFILMANKVLQMAMLVGIGLVAVSGYGAGVSQEKNLIMHQMLVKVDEYTNTICRLQKENAQIEADKKTLRETLDSITVPDYKVVTNVVRLSANATRTDVKKIKFKQEARVRKLAKALGHPVIQRLYAKYCDESSVSLLDEFKAEWRMAEESFSDTKQMMENNSKIYKSEIGKIDASAKKQYDDDVKEVDDRISALRDERRSVKASLPPLTRDPPRILEIDREIKELNEKKNMLKKIYNSNKYASSYAAAGDRKADANDAVLAAADLRNQHQNLYMTYNNKLKQDLQIAMTSKLAANRVVIEEKTKELNRLHFLLSNPDFIKADVAGAIVDKQMTEAIGAEFGVDVKEINAETQRREEVKRREKEKADREAKEKARREEREKKQAEEKRREEREKAKREERDRKELEERQKSLSSLPKSVEGWKRGVGEDNEVYAECLFSDGGNPDRTLFPPIRIRVTPTGNCAYVQPSPDGSMCSVVIFRGDSQSDREPSYRAYLALVGAAQKAKAWRKTASERGEDEFVKEIPITNAPNCFSGILANNGGRSSGGEGSVRFWFEVHKLEGVAVRDRKDQSVGSWFRGLTKDMDHVYCLKIGNASTAILVNLDSIDGFLKAANPIGAFEALQKFNDLYK